MIRRLNYTGRRKIPRSRLTVQLVPAADGIWAFDAQFDLSGFGFPADARVYIEAYNVTSYMRFMCGTVGAKTFPLDLRLTEITPNPLPKFRLKVVERRRRQGLLLGVADRIVPLRPDEELASKQPLLPVDFRDLGERIWRLDLSDWPVLELNHRVEGIAEMARSADTFLALVYPEVVRRILYEAVVEQDQTDPGFDDSEWTSLWLRYICGLSGVAEPPGGGTTEEARLRKAEWIEGAVQAFCRSREARVRFERAAAQRGL